jgi:acetate kinase
MKPGNPLILTINGGASSIKFALYQVGDPAATTGRAILAHLGNGASMAAVRDGKGIDPFIQRRLTAVAR